jgi:hypothetical protein
MITRATIGDVNVSPVSTGQLQVFTCGMQFVDLDPTHYMPLQS